MVTPIFKTRNSTEPYIISDIELLEYDDKKITERPIVENR